MVADHERRPSRLAPSGARGALLLAAGWAVLSCSCGGEEPGAAPRPAAAEAPPAAASGSQRPGARGTGAPPAEVIGEEPYGSAELGALAGEIRFEGTPPARFPLGADQKAECKHHPEVQHLSDIAIVNDGKVQYAFVHLKFGVDAARVPPVPQAALTLDQRGCIYTPHVLGLRAGQKLLVTNSDPTSHNVHVLAKRNSAPANRTMGQGQAALEYLFERSETVLFKCDIHPWMGAVVHVEEHPWFAVSDGAGRFRIEDIPPGDYVVEAEHELFEGARGSVKIEGGKTRAIALVLRPEGP